MLVYRRVAGQLPCGLVAGLEIGGGVRAVCLAVRRLLLGPRFLQAVVLLSVVWTTYFDDYVSFCGAGSEYHLDLCLSHVLIDYRVANLGEQRLRLLEFGSCPGPSPQPNDSSLGIYKVGNTSER